MIHVYAPTNDAHEQSKEDFYGKLQEVTEQVHNHDLLIITGEMNAKVGNLVNGNIKQNKKKTVLRKVCSIRKVNKYSFLREKVLKIPYVSRLLPLHQWIKSN